jgi:hypothetical protein
MAHAFKAIRLWDALDCFDVRLAKMTAQSTGPTVAKNMAKAASARAKLFGALIWSALIGHTLQDARRPLLPTTAQPDSEVASVLQRSAAFGAAALLALGKAFRTSAVYRL